MEDINYVPIAVSTVPLGIDKDGDKCEEDWEYATIMGTLMYLAQNSRPDIAYVVYQCARFNHASRSSRATGIKRILRYLQAIKDKVLILNPSTKFQDDYYVDADFSGL